MHRHHRRARDAQGGLAAADRHRAPPRGGQQAGRQGRIRPLTRAPMNRKPGAMIPGCWLPASSLSSFSRRSSRWRSPRREDRRSSGSTLIAYVLPAAVVDTLILLAGVGASDRRYRHRQPPGWSRPTTFPDVKVVDWALLLPLAVPTYIIAYAYLDVLHPGRPGADSAARHAGIRQPPRLPASRHPVDDWLHRAARVRALSVRVSDDTRDVPDADGQSHRRGAYARRRPCSDVLPRGACRWHVRRSSWASAWRCWKR